MPTIADNIRGMAALVADVKKTYHLTENTVLRIVDMNFALAQQQSAPSFGPDEDMEFPNDGLPVMFPITPEDIEAVEDLPDPEDEVTNTGQIVVLADNDVVIDHDDTPRKDN